MAKEVIHPFGEEWGMVEDHTGEELGVEALAAVESFSGDVASQDWDGRGDLDRDEA